MNNNSKIEALSKAIELISDHKNWTVDCLAREAAGFSINPKSDNACKWCAVGSIVKFSDEVLADDICEIILKRNAQSLSYTNDFCGREASLSVMEDTLEYLKSL